MQYKHQVREQSTVWGSNSTKLNWEEKKKREKEEKGGKKKEEEKKRFKAKLGDLNIFL